MLVQDNQEVEEWFDKHDLLRDDNKIAREARHDRYRCRRDERLAEEPHVTPMSLCALGGSGATVTATESRRSVAMMPWMPERQRQ